MTKVTISYAGADAPAAGLVASKLEKLGYKVSRAPASAPPARRTRKGSASGPVLVLWSRAYASAAGRPKAALATLRLDAAAPPARLKAPAIDLRQWRGREDHRGWRKVVAALGAPTKALRTTGPARTSAAFASPPATALDIKAKKAGGSPLAGVLLFLLLAAAGGWAAWTYLPH
jgi:hypothetical protein